jgi:hypothetical protein
MIVVHFIPYYWGVERKAVDRSLITRSTLYEVLPPFRRSMWAVRIRVSPWHWLHMGRYYHEPEAGRWGLDASVDEISKWRGPHVVENEEDEDTVPTAPI